MQISKTGYVDEAEKVIENLKKDRNGDFLLTTSKIRNLLAMSNDIYTQIINTQSTHLDEDIQSRIEYLRVRFVYECGRDEGVMDFAEKAKLLTILKEIDDSKDNYCLFNNYMEALVAFHRYHKGKN